MSIAADTDTTYTHVLADLTAHDVDVVVVPEDAETSTSRDVARAPDTNTVHTNVFGTSESWLDTCYRMDTTGDIEICHYRDEKR